MSPPRNLDFSEVIELKGLSARVDLAPIRALEGVHHVERGGGLVRLLVKRATDLLEPLQKIISREKSVRNQDRTYQPREPLSPFDQRRGQRMIRSLPIVLLTSLLLVAPAQAATPLDYTRTVLEQARTIVADNQSSR